MIEHGDTELTSDSELGTALVEYALLVLLVAIVALVAVVLAGDTLSATYDTIAQSVSNASR